MKVLAVVGAGKGGNTDALVNAFVQSAVKVGQQAEIEYLFEKKNIHGCNGCYICRKTGSGTCTMHDDLTPVLKKAAEADVIVLASPVYFYNVSAQLKMFMDRTYAISKQKMEKS